MAVNYSMSGLVPASAVVTPREGAHRQSTSHVKAITKTAVMRYLGRFFDETGNYRELTRQIFPDMLKFVTDLDFSPSTVSDADNKVSMPIFKFYNEVKSHLPCIVISESGTTYKSSGLGFDQGAYRAADHAIYRVIHVMRQVNITISVVTGDQSTTDSIVDVLCLAFGELSGFTSGMAITDDTGGGHWIVRFPKLIEPGSAERSQQGDDPKDLVWASQTNIPCDFEDSFLIPFEETKSQVFASSPDNMPKLKFDMSNIVRVGRTSDGFIRGLAVGQTVSCSDPSTMIMKRGSMPGQYYLTGKKPGRVKLRIMEGTVGDQPGGMIRPNIIEEFEISVAY